MRDWAAAYLRCPACRGALDVEGSMLRCRACDETYPIVDGVPRLLPRSLRAEAGASGMTPRIMRTFAFEWREYARFGWDDPEYDLKNEERVFAAKSFLTEADLRGKVVLDAGCGNGRYAYWAAARGARVIAIDVSDAVDVAARNTASIPNVQVVQADIFNLPFAEAAFDAIYSIGVLMCTGDAPRAFAGLARAVRPGGRLTAHVYGRGNIFYEGINRAMRAWTTRLSLPALQRFTAILFRVRSLLRRFGMLRAVGRFVRLDGHPHCIFDWYAAPSASHHTHDEVRSWFARAGFDVVATNQASQRSAPQRLRQRVIGSAPSVTVSGRRRERAGPTAAVTA